MNSVEICAGAGGQALGLEMAGFEHAALVEIEPPACATLLDNRPHWNVISGDVKEFDGKPYRGVELVCGGVPCPPFSVAGKQLGSDDERDLFPEALRLAAEIKPQAVMLENVRGLLDPKFASYRESVEAELDRLGFTTFWRLLHASDYGVSQLRPRAICVAVKRNIAQFFKWPELSPPPPTVGELLLDLMAEREWDGAYAWSLGADAIAPTLVGGSRKHGGPDLGPTRAKLAWARLGVDGLGLANEAPGPDFEGMPKITVKMAARIQGFPDAWKIHGKKTAAYRQVGNAFPPPVAAAVGRQIKIAIEAGAARSAKKIVLPRQGKIASANVGGVVIAQSSA